jgi:hypothetical protein
MAKKVGRPAKAQAKAETTTTTALVPMIKTSALSADVGPRVTAMLWDWKRADMQGKELVRSGETRRREGLQLNTMAIAKAALADSSIDLASVFLPESDVARTKLYNQVWVALGYKHAVVVKDKPRLDWTSGVKEIMNSPKDDPEHKAKESVRTNLSSQLGKCIQGAIFLVENKVKVQEDKKSGTLQITGPAVQKHFGEASVLLNENQTVNLLDKRGNVIGKKDLKARPSFTEIAKLGAEAHGKTFNKRVDSRAVSKDPNDYVVQVCESLVAALEKSPTLNEAATKALSSLQSALETFLD